MTILTWAEVEEVATKLALKIKSSDYEPTHIVAVTTGGLIPAYLLAKRLGVKSIYTATVTRKGRETKRPIRHIPSIEPEGARVLVVDEITETGLSLRAVVDELSKQLGPTAVKSATLGANKDYGEFTADYYVLIEKGDWIVFPWEHEDFPKYSASARGLT